MPKFGTGKEQDEEKDNAISIGCLSGFRFTYFRYMVFLFPKKIKTAGKIQRNNKRQKILQNRQKKKKEKNIISQIWNISII